MRVLIGAYVCDPFGGSEGANAWFTAEGLAYAGAEVRILTRACDLARTTRGIDACEPEVAGRLSVTGLDESVPMALAGGQVGVYARYATWQRRAHRWASDPSNGTWDIGHNVSWGSLSHPIGLAGCPFPLVVGPVGGGQSLHPEHEQWYDGPLGHDRLRRSALRAAVPLNPIARHAARRAALIMATNNESADLARSLGARTVDLQLAEGVRETAIREEPPAFPQDPVIIWIGRFLPLKAARLAVRAFRIVHEHELCARLVMVGDGPTIEATRESAKDLANTGAVQFAGRLPWSDAQDVLGSARVHLFTSVRDSSSAQTLEAATLGVPTVALDVFGASAFLQRPGFRLVDPLPGDGLDQRFADALIDVLTWDESRWLAESAAVRDFAATQTYRERAQKYLHLYTQVATSQR